MPPKSLEVVFLVIKTSILPCWGVEVAPWGLSFKTTIAAPSVLMMPTAVLTGYVDAGTF